MLTAQLEHPHIVPIHELGVTGDGRLYYAMKKVDGVSMAEVFCKRLAEDETTRRRWTRRRSIASLQQQVGHRKHRTTGRMKIRTPRWMRP